MELKAVMYVDEYSRSPHRLEKLSLSQVKGSGRQLLGEIYT
jgi:hypothetical protein